MNTLPARATGRTPAARMPGMAQASGTRARVRDVPARGCDRLIVYLFVFFSIESKPFCIFGLSSGIKCYQSSNRSEMMLNMIPNIRITAARLASLLVLAALLGAGVQAAVAQESTLTMSVGKMGELGTDPTVSDTLMPVLGGVGEPYHYWVHFSPLITLDSEGNIIPWMAESYEISDDYRTLTFHLRKGIKFADGTPLNASILKFNFDRIIKYGLDDYAGKNSTRVDWYVFRNYDYSEAIDENTFSIHFAPGWLDMPHEFALKGVYGIFISPTDVDPAWDIRGVLKPEKRYNGLGSYYVDENESIPKQKIVLVRRHSWLDDYNFHTPKLDQLVLTYIEDPQVAMMALEKGEIDYILRYWNAQPDMLRQIESNSKITIATRPQTMLYFLATAWWKEPFNGSDGILLRKAINYALNRTEIAKGAFNGYAEPATDSMILSSQRPDSPECCNSGYDYDIDKAKQLLAEAGWNDTDGDGTLDKNGMALRDLDLVFQDTPDLWGWKDQALVVQSQLKIIGINIKIRGLDSAGRVDAMKKGDYDLLGRYTSGRTNAATKELGGFVLPDPWINYYANQNDTLKTIVKNAQTSLSEKERDRNLCEACNILYEEAGIIPLVYPSDYAVMSSKVKGFKMGPYSGAYFADHIEECWMEE